MLTSEDVRRFHERLKAEPDAIESRIAAIKSGIQETVQDESGVGDSGDEASLLYDREFEIDENALDRKALAQVNRALARHVVEVFKLLGGGLRDGGWMGEGRPKGGHALASCRP